VYGADSINFLDERYSKLVSQVIAARIIAENPDDGFKTSTGSIERIMFQSSPNLWGHFPVGANGGFHKFPDSFFGLFLFAKIPTRESARKALVLALKEMKVRGDIHNSVEYIVKLLETEAFKENTIDTSLLDGIIKEKAVTVQVQPHLHFVAAAIFKVLEHVKVTTEQVKESFRTKTKVWGQLKPI
jgi:acetyl-CoA carboxylase/biotin carboxylase 1